MLDVVEELFQQGVELHKSGKVEVASQLYTAVLKAQPEHPTANHNMGILAVGGGKVQEALPYFEAALEANADTAQFWLSYIAALIEVERMADAQAVFDQAKSNGAKGDGFDQLERRLNVLDEELLETSITASEAHQDQPNILETLKLDQALRLAKKTAKEGSLGDAKRIYQDVLLKFPKNQRAIDGIKALAGVPVDKAFKVQEPPENQQDSLINLYSQGQLQQALEQANVLLQRFPNSSFLYNICGAVYKGLGQLDASIEAYTKLLAIKPDYADAYYNMGVVLQDQGKLDEAIEAYTKALSIRPDYAEAYYNMGSALKEQGKLEEAAEAYEKAITIKPDYADAYYNMGAALKEQGKLEEAIEAYIKALAIKPNYAEAYHNMGIALKEQGKLEEAIDAYTKALAIKPDYAEAYNNMGIALKEQGELEEAIEAYNKALAIKPDCADAYYNMGNALHEQGKLEEVMASYNKALAIKPDYAEVYNNMGIALKEQGKLEEAIEAYTNALAIKPDYADAHSNMAVSLQEQGKLDEAIEACNKAIAIKPNSADAHHNMGNVLQVQGKLEEAIEACNKAIAIKPDFAQAHHNLSFALLKNGRLSEGLDEYEWRWKTAEFSRWKRLFSQPLWDGKTSLKGKRILVWSEQGVGDTINWSSCLSLVSAQARHCILECQEKLVPLLARSFPDVEVRPENRNSDSERDDFDFHLPMGSLYRLLIPKLFQNSKANAFLVPEPARVSFWRERLTSLGNGPFTGISWKSSDMSLSRLPNYAPVSEWSSILTIPGVTFINLQYTDAVDDLAKIQNEFGVTVHNFDDLDHYNNLADVAALSAALDVVVSVQSAVPAISAGVGTCTKLALWRQSSWNNSLISPPGPLVDKFEKNTWEPWSSVFSLIAEDIIELAGSKG